MLSLPPRLATPFLVKGRVAFKVMLDLTVYLVGPTEAELEAMCDLYDRICPPKRKIAYQTDELIVWSNLSAPELTESGRRAAAAGVKRPYLEPTRNRIRDGRAFAVSFWDRRPIDDPDGSWSFTCRRIKRRSTGFYGFARFLVPLATDCGLLPEIAGALAEGVEFFSGHGGLVFVYEPWLKLDAFKEIYALARRHWGVDIEDLDASILVIRDHVKGVNWVTLIGNPLAGRIEAGLAGLAGDSQVKLTRHRQGLVMVAGAQPVAGDRNLSDPGLDPYFEVAGAIAPLFPLQHPDFAGTGFKGTDSTIAWIRRFIEPARW